jgi:hypothetical protein
VRASAGPEGLACGSRIVDDEAVIAVAEAWNTFQGGGLDTTVADVDCRASGGCGGVEDIVAGGVLTSMWETACLAPGR